MVPGLIFAACTPTRTLVRVDLPGKDRSPTSAQAVSDALGPTATPRLRRVLMHEYVMLGAEQGHVLHGRRPAFAVGGAVVGVQ